MFKVQGLGFEVEGLGLWGGSISFFVFLTLFWCFFGLASV